MLRFFRMVTVCLAAGLGACAHGPGDSVASVPSGATAWTPEQIARWQPMHLPGKRVTDYALGEQAGRAAVRAQAESAVSMLRQPLRVEPDQLGHVEFAWNVPALIDGADVGQRHSDDSPARLVLAFDGDRSTFSAKNAMLSELAHAMTGEPLPYATLMYICATPARSAQWYTARAPTASASWWWRLARSSSTTGCISAAMYGQTSSWHLVKRRALWWRLP